MSKVKRMYVVCLGLHRNLANELVDRFTPREVFTRSVSFAAFSSFAAKYRCRSNDCLDQYRKIMFIRSLDCARMLECALGCTYGTAARILQKFSLRDLTGLKFGLGEVAAIRGSSIRIERLIRRMFAGTATLQPVDPEFVRLARACFRDKYVAFFNREYEQQHLTLLDLYEIWGVFDLWNHPIFNEQCGKRVIAFDFALGTPAEWIEEITMLLRD